MDMQDILTTPRTWVTVAFFIFMGLAARKIWGLLTGILDTRAATIRAELEEAASLRAQAEAMLSDASAKRDAALKEAEALLASARVEAARLADAARADAAASAKRREKMALDRIAAAEKAAVTEVRNQAATLAVQAAETVFREHLPQAAAAGLVAKAIDGLPAALATQ